MGMIRLLKFDPKRVSVSFGEATRRSIAEPQRERRYTLTHNDLTRQLTLSVARDFDGAQTALWYTRLLRDEVLAEWRDDGLHVHCNVSVEGHWWISWAKSLRSVVFRQKLPLVLDTLRYAERELLARRPRLNDAPVFVHFHGDFGTPPSSQTDSSGTDSDRAFRDAGVKECWGAFRDAGSTGSPSSRELEVFENEVAENRKTGIAFARAVDMWSVTVAAATVCEPGCVPEESVSVCELGGEDAVFSIPASASSSGASNGAGGAGVSAGVSAGVGAGAGAVGARTPSVAPARAVGRAPGR